MSDTVGTKPRSRQMTHKNARYGTCSRTLSVKHTEWARVVSLAKVEQRTVNKQIMWLVEERIRKLTPDAYALFLTALKEYELANPYPAPFDPAAVS
jgi:macrodomain Ter protein organizer (MatP/YcbG family)